jgi:hypothetical protein
MFPSVYVILSRVELYLFGLIGAASHPDVQKIRIMYFSLKVVLMGGLKFCCYYLQYVPVSKHFDHAWLEVLEAITRYCTWSDNR